MKRIVKIEMHRPLARRSVHVKEMHHRRRPAFLYKPTVGIAVVGKEPGEILRRDNVE